MLTPVTSRITVSSDRHVFLSLRRSVSFPACFLVSRLFNYFWISRIGRSQTFFFSFSWQKSFFRVWTPGWGKNKNHLAQSTRWSLVHWQAIFPRLPHVRATRPQLNNASERTEAVLLIPRRRRQSKRNARMVLNTDNVERISHQFLKQNVSRSHSTPPPPIFLPLHPFPFMLRLASHSVLMTKVYHNYLWQLILKALFMRALLCLNYHQRPRTRSKYRPTLRWV